MDFDPLHGNSFEAIFVIRSCPRLIMASFVTERRVPPVAVCRFGFHMGVVGRDAILRGIPDGIATVRRDQSRDRA